MHKYLPILLFCGMSIMGFSAEADALPSAASDTIVAKDEEVISRIEHGCIIYDVPQLLTKVHTQNAYGTILSLPGISVGVNGLTVGGSVATLTIDGKDTTLPSSIVAQRLQQMPAALLKEIEVILGAPATAHERGIVINVVTKDRYDTRHVSGQVQTYGTFSDYAMGGTSGHIHYGVGRWALDASYGYNGGKSKSREWCSAHHPMSIGLIEYSEEDGYLRDLNTHNLQLNTKYAIGHHHSIDVDLTARFSEMDLTWDVDGTFDQLIKLHTDEDLLGADVHYLTPFNLNVGVSFVYTSTPKRGNYEINYDKGNLAGNLKSRNDSRRLYITADQNIDLSRQWTIYYGGKLHLEGYHEAGYTWHQRAVSVSADVSKSWAQYVTLRMGAEVENHHNPQINDWIVYPSMNLIYNVNTENALNLSLTTNSEYPDYKFMSGLIDETLYRYYTALAGVHNERNLNLSLMWRLHDKYSFTAFYAKKHNAITTQPYQSHDLYRCQYVLGNMDSYYSGVHANGAHSFGPFGCSATGSLFYMTNKSHNFAIPFDRHKWAANLSADAGYTIPGVRLTISAGITYQSALIDGLWDIDDVFQLQSSLGWNSKNGHWRASLTGINLTNARTTMHAQTNDQDFTINERISSRSVMASLIYSF